MKGTKQIGLIMAIGLSSIAISAQAADLVLNNNTASYVTSYLNDMVCSNALGNVGVTKPHEQNHVVSSATVGMACLFHESACKADIYLSNNCTGQKIATVVLNTRTSSIASIVMNSPAYAITHAGFSFTLSPV